MYFVPRHVLVCTAYLCMYRSLLHRTIVSIRNLRDLQKMFNLDR